MTSLPIPSLAMTVMLYRVISNFRMFPRREWNTMRGIQIGLMLIAGILASMLVVAGCGDYQGSAARQMEFISGSPTGGWFPVAVAIAELVNKHYKDRPISVVPGAGGIANPLRVGSGRAEFGISYAPFLVAAKSGDSSIYEQAMPDVRAIAAMAINVLHLIVSAEIPAEDLEALARGHSGLRVGTGPMGSAELFALEAIFGEFGTNFETIRNNRGRVDLMNTAGRNDGWKNRQLDMVNFFISRPAAQVMDLMAARKSKLVSIEEEVRQTLNEKWGYLNQTIPANTYPGQDADVQTIALPFVIFAHARVDADMVYLMTEEIAENKDKLTNALSALKDWRPEKMVEAVGIEFHEGALRYYRERGWIE